MNLAHGFWTLAITCADLALACVFAWYAFAMFRERWTAGMTAFPREFPLMALYALAALCAAVGAYFAHDLPNADAPGRLILQALFAALLCAQGVILVYLRRRGVPSAHSAGGEIG